MLRISIYFVGLRDA